MAKKRRQTKKRAQRERKEAARHGVTVEELRTRKAGGTGRGQRRNNQAHVPGYGSHEMFRREVDQ